MVSAAQELLPRADTAAGKALAACAGRLFPWAHEARGWLSGDQVKVRRRSEASELIREAPWGGVEAWGRGRARRWTGPW